MPAAFHEIRFPLDVAEGARGGPERLTDVVVMASGREERNARWAHARRRFDAGRGVRTLAQLADVVAFFEERRGRLHGFRFRDPLDWTSGVAGAAPVATQQLLGTGDGTRAAFQLVKTYGGGFAPYVRPIRKPVAGSVVVAVDGVAKLAGVDFDVDAATGLVTFRAGRIPPAGKAVTAGFQFDVPVRFDTDRIEIDFTVFEAGQIPLIPLIEIVP